MRRDLLLVLSLFLILIGILAYNALLRQQQAQESENFIAFSTHSSQAAGALALYEWLGDLGLQASRIESGFRLTDRPGALVILAPTGSFDPSQIDEILAWTARGHTLVLAESNLFRRDALLQALHVQLTSLPAFIQSAVLVQPTLDGVPEGAAQIETNAALVLDRGDYVTHLAVDGRPVLVSLEQGQGHIWLTSAPDLFTNRGLAQPGNAPLVGAILSTLPRGALVQFDEYHLGLHGSADDVSLQSLLFGTPWGWAILYALLLLFFALLINGRRFGRVIPLPRALARRSPAEYVTSLAQLLRRAAKRQGVLSFYRRDLKRVLGRPFGLDPGLPDDQFVYELARFRDPIDPELPALLRSLDEKHPGEQTLVRLAARAVQFAESVDKNNRS